MSVFRSANPFDQLTPGVRKLLIANVAVFFAQIAFPNTLEVYLGLTPALVVSKYWVWQIFTYAFLHGNGWHLFFNMFSLWMFASHIEGQWGTKTFLKYYFLCSTGAALGQFLLAPNTLVIGASGAIYGLLLAFGLMFPDSIIYLFFVFPLRAIQAVFFIAFLTFVMAVGAGGARIAHVAHLSGMLTGFLFFKVPGWWRRFQNSLRKTKLEVIYPTDDLSKEVDRILEKISAQGVDSLTPGEHETMQKYAHRKK